jgi:hypothetical protein
MVHRHIGPRIISSSIESSRVISANSAATEAETPIVSDGSTDRTLERARKTERAAAWEWSICATVLLLFGSATLQREYQLFQQLNVRQVFSQKTITIPRPTGLDFAPYYVTGRVALGEGDSRLYYPPPGSKAEQNRELLEGTVPVDTPWSRVAQRWLGVKTTTYYIYPPLFGLLFSPIARMRPIMAFFLWRGLSMIWVLLSMYLVLRAVRLKTDPLTLLVATVGVLCFFPLTETLYQGQVNCLILFLWTAGFYCARTQKVPLSAFCFAINTFVKITPVLVVPILLLRRQWKWLISYFVSVAGLLALSIWRVGWQAHWVYASKILPTLSAGTGGYLLKSLGTVVRDLYWRRVTFGASGSWEIPLYLNVLVRVISIALYAGVLFYFRKKRRSGEVALSEELAIAALVSLIISPVTWRHHFVLILLPLIYFWMQSREGWSKVRLWVFPLLTLALGTPFADLVLLRVHHGLLQALLASVFLLATCVLLFLCLQDYGRPQSVSSRANGNIRSITARAA